MRRAWLGLGLTIAACGAPDPPTTPATSIIVDATNASDGRRSPAPSALVVASEPVDAGEAGAPPRPAGLDDAPPPHPRGPVSVVTVDSPPTMAEVQRVVMGLRPRLRACHQRGLNEDPFMSGRVVLKMTVNAKGEVTAAKAERAGTVSPAVGACMEAIAKRVSFEGGPFQLSIPITCTIAATGP